MATDVRSLFKYFIQNDPALSNLATLTQGYRDLLAQVIANPSLGPGILAEVDAVLAQIAALTASSS